MQKTYCDNCKEEITLQADLARLMYAEKKVNAELEAKIAPAQMDLCAKCRDKVIEALGK